MQTIYLSEQGVRTGEDITVSLCKLFCEYRENTTFVFENGDYYFSPHAEMKADYRLSNTDVAPERTLGLWLKKMKNCTLVGNGARLWFAGHMQPFTLDECENVTIQGFVINWKKPMVAEGIVQAVSDKTVDVYVDPDKFPHRMRDGQLEFDVGADEWYPLVRWGHNVFEPHFRTLRRKAGDCISTGNGVTDLGGDRYRIESHREVVACPGDIVVLRHNSRKHAGIFSEHCRDITIEDVTVHSCGGLGCLSQFCHNMTYRRVHFVPDRAAGRLITNGRDDGMHITCNSGTVTITECTFLGLMDDPINVHACCVKVTEAIGNRALRCQYGHVQAQGFKYWAKAGDEIVFIDRGNMSCVYKAKAKAYMLEAIDTFTIEFEEELPDFVLKMAQKGAALAIDNVTNTSAFVCTNNRFGSCRARSVLISTPKPVLIENNYFESSGSAVLVAGDANGWFESGECHDVEIRGNVFTQACLTSNYEFCEGVISVCPVVPKPEVEKPFHKHIRIVDNTFDTADAPVLYAYSCEGLQFVNNRIFKSPAAEKWHPNENRIKLRYCVGASLQNNQWIGTFSDDTILEQEHCLHTTFDH
ncbi:MAG: hypothetical protein IJO59_04200 [Clostridia bacterium]|nr:hypothetical protein [Clostridia bacterium]